MPVIVATVFLWVLACSPIIYAYIYVHKGNMLRLANVAPNQFVFPIFVFPFLSFAILSAFYKYVWQLGNILVNNSAKTNSTIINTLLYNPSYFLLASNAIALVLAIVVYNTSPWTFDKLQPVYAVHALQELSEIRVESTKLKPAAIGKAKEQAAEFVENLKLSGNILTNAEILNLSKYKYISVIRDIDLPHKFRMFNKAILFLNIVQLMAIASTAAILLSLVAVTMAINAQLKSIVAVHAILEQGVIAATIAFAWLGMFGLLYGMLNVELGYAIRSDQKIHYEWIVLGIVILCVSIMIFNSYDWKNIDDVKKLMKISRSIWPIGLLLFLVKSSNKIIENLEANVGMTGAFGNKIWFLVCIIALGIVSMAVIVAEE